MFKKTLVALALAGISTSALAVDMATNTAPQTLSVEGVAADVLASDEASADAVTVTLGAEYTAGDTITFTIAGGTFADTGYTLTASNKPNVNDKEVTWGLLNATATTLTFRATDVQNSGSGGAGTGADGTKDVSYLLAGTDAAGDLSVKVTSIAKDGKVTITADAKTSTNITIDDQGAKNTESLFTGVQQLTATVTKGTGKVDVSNERKVFEDLADTKFSVTYTEAAATVGDITLATTDVTVAGDFTGVASLTELGADNAVGGAAANADTALTIAEDKKSATMTLTGAARDLNFVYALPTVEADKVALTAPQDFKITATAKYNSTSTDVAKDAVASSWTLNGASQEIDFMPFGTEYAQSITVINEGDVVGAISVDFIADGKSTTKNLTATAAAKSVTNISAEIKTLAAEIGITGNAKLRIVVNSPNDDIAISGVYYHKADGDRVKSK